MIIRIKNIIHGCKNIKANNERPMSLSLIIWYKVFLIKKIFDDNNLYDRFKCKCVIIVTCRILDRLKIKLWKTRNNKFEKKIGENLEKFKISKVSFDNFQTTITSSSGIVWVSSLNIWKPFWKIFSTTPSLRIFRGA